MRQTDKPATIYLVTSPGGTRLYVKAASGDQAKRIYCREFGIKASDYYCGIHALNARKLKPKEAEAWEEQAPAMWATFRFIKGMMEITAKAYAAQQNRAVT